MTEFLSPVWFTFGFTFIFQNYKTKHCLFQIFYVFRHLETLNKFVKDTFSKVSNALTLNTYKGDRGSFDTSMTILWVYSIHEKKKN